MKMPSRILVLILTFALFIGCQNHSSVSDGVASEISGSTAFVINEAFLSSDLSQYAMDDTLFLVKFIDGDEDIVAARDVEEYVYGLRGFWGDFAIVPRYAGSVIRIERMRFNEHLILVVDDTPFESIATDNYALLIKNALGAALSFPRVTVTYNDVSVSYDIRKSGIGHIDAHYVTDGYVLWRTPMTSDMWLEDQEVTS